MLLQNFRPESKLVTPHTDLQKARFPVVDAHNHLGGAFGEDWRKHPIRELLDRLDEAGVVQYVDLDGGWGEDILHAHLDYFKQAAPDRFHIFGGVDWQQWPEIGINFPEWAASRLRAQKARGAEGLKIWKGLGLTVKDERGRLVNVDDARLAPIWETAAELDLPALIHVADPVAFFDPLDEHNERWEELQENPDWIFTSPPFPPFLHIISGLANLINAHPRTTFIGAHVGCYAENLAWVAAVLESCPNFLVDISARVAELGRQPYAARKFMLQYADRILFGSDMGPHPAEYRVMYRFLETADEYFSYSPAGVGGQGRWNIYGLSLPDAVLAKVYYQNAQKTLSKGLTMKNNYGKHTYAEIHSQPAAWQAALDVIGGNRQALEQIDLRQFDQVVFTGCGSTYYLSLSAAVTLQQASGVLCRAVPASELLFSPDAVLSHGRTLLVAISRSGSTSETIQAVHQFQQQERGMVIGVSNYGNEPLAKMADIALVIPAGQEQSVAQTRSFASMLLAATAMTAIFSRKWDWLEQMQGLPAIGTRLIEKYEGLARTLGENLAMDRFYFLGSGERYGLACETNLKLKEMTLTHSEPFHFFEFRHGPMAMVTPTTQIIGLHSSVNRIYEQAVLDEMAALGAQTLSLANSEADISFESQLPQSLQNVLYLPILQLMAYYRSIRKGLNPDQPHNLSAVVKLDFKKESA